MNINEETMEKYFIRVSATYTPQNKSQEAAIELVNTYDHTLLIGAGAIKLFRKHLSLDLANISDMNSRCKPVTADTFLKEGNTERLTIAQGKVLLDIHTVNEEYDFNS